MNTYVQFLEARALSEALLLKHADPRESRIQNEIIDRTFRTLASQLGFRIERIAAPVKEVA